MSMDWGQKFLPLLGTPSTECFKVTLRVDRQKLSGSEDGLKVEIVVTLAVKTAATRALAFATLHSAMTKGLSPAQAGETLILL